ncbi:MAG: FG-GAP-like repeat-containing protein [Thermoanaerobaculia bacterium]|nr:FG-GAP-like repeat-containing protein [Thermoanaerobaculia bacterium]
MRRSRLLLAASLAAAAALTLAVPHAPAQEISFSGAAWYPTGALPFDVALGDFDGDGILDAVTPDHDADALTVRRGDGIGGFGPRLAVPVGDKPWKVAAGTLNADEFTDLVVCHASADGTWILLADGLGGFAAPVPFEASGSSVPALVDLDVDGDLDLVLARQYSTLRAYLGDGSGGFGAATGDWGVGNRPSRLRPGYLNSDAWPDILLTGYNPDGHTFGLLGDGAGGFSSVLYYGNYPVQGDLAIAHLNGDAHWDWAIALENGYVDFRFGDGNGNFPTASSLSLGGFGRAIAVEDWNGDGFVDLAITTADTWQRLFLGNGTGTFTALPVTSWPPVNCQAQSLAAADLDLDGDADLLCPDYSSSRLVVSLGDGTGSFTAGRTFPAGPQPRALAIAPFDAEPGPDLLVGSYAYGGGFRLLSNLGGGRFGPPAAFAPAGAEVFLGAAAGDLDADGDQDAVLASWPSVSRVGVALSNGTGGFPDWGVFDPLMVPWAVALGHFDADPWLDLAVHGRQGVNGVALLPGNGTGGFGPPVFSGAAGSNSTVGFAVADLDGDGDLDVAHPNAEAASATVRLGDGAGGLGTAATYPVTGTCNDVGAADLDGDFDLDLVVLGSRITVLLQTGGGSGSFAFHQEVVPDFLLHQAALADFDGDGDVDVAVVGDQNGILAYANDGNGTFSGPIRFGSWGKADNLRTEDLDGDGLPDLVATHFGTDRVIVLRNNLYRLADLAVAVDDGQASAVPGEAVSYAVTVTNLGPALVGELTLAVLDTPPLLSRVFTPGAGSYTPATGAWTGLELRHGESVTLTLEGTIDPWVTGMQSVSASVVAPAAVSDPVAANDAAADDDALTPATDLGLAKSDGQTSAVVGAPIVYTLTVTNHGPSAAPALTLLDPPPALLLSPVFTAQRGSYDDATGAWSGALVGPGETVTLELAGTVDPGAIGDLLANTASLAARAGATDPVAANDTASDVDALLRVADLGLVADNGHVTVAPGEAVVYTLTLVNGGPSRVDAAALVEFLPPALLSPVHTPAAGSFDPATGAWTGLGLDPGGSATMTVAGLLDLGATGTLSYSAVVFAPLATSDPLAANNVTADHDPISPEVDLEVGKSDGREGVWPGETVVYAIAVANPGPSHAPGTVVTDAFPATTLAGCTWTCAGSGGATCPAGPVAGDIATAVDLPAGGSVLFTATCTATAAVATDPIVNTATATPAAGIAERDPADNSATDLTRPAALFADGFESGDFGAWSTNGGA